MKAGNTASDGQINRSRRGVLKTMMKRRKRILSGGGLGKFDASKCIADMWCLPRRAFISSSTGNLTDLRLSAAASTGTCQSVAYCRMSRSADLMLRGTVPQCSVPVSGIWGKYYQY